MNEDNKKMDKEDNRVMIGEKPFMNYVTAVVIQFTAKQANEVVVMARGKFISRAVDIAEVAVKRFLKGQLEYGNIKVDSEEFKNKEERNVRVSSIEITLKKI